jgi:hypothetical protein
MIRQFFIGFWVCAIMACTSYAVAHWKANGGDIMPKPQEYLDGLDYEKTPVLNIPMIADGQVQGYVVAQFVFTADAKMLRQLTVPPNSFVIDEAFRAVYTDEKLDFKDLRRYDLSTLTKAIKERVNLRMQTSVIQDVLVEEFNYVSKSDIRK